GRRRRGIRSAALGGLLRRQLCITHRVSGEGARLSIAGVPLLLLRLGEVEVGQRRLVERVLLPVGGVGAGERDLRVIDDAGGHDRPAGGDQSKKAGAAHSSTAIPCARKSVKASAVLNLKAS